MRTRAWLTWKPLAIAVMTAGLAGCGTSNHQKSVDAANTRWKAMRSTLMLQMAQQQFDAGDLDQAEKSVTEAIKFDSNDPRLFTLAGRVALERGQLERGYHRFKTAIGLDPRYAPAHYFQGIVMQRWAQFDTALIFYRRAYEVEPDNAAYLLAITEMLVLLDQTQEAMDLLNEKLTYFDMNASIRVAIGQLYAMRGDFQSAVSYFQQAQLIRPDDLQIEEQLALAMLRAGQAAQAVQKLQRLCQEPTLAHRRDLTQALADGYGMTGQTGKAKEIYIKMTRDNPMDAEAWIKLGELALAQRDSGGAMLAATRVKILAPDRYEGFLLSGLVFSHRGQIQQALESFDEASRLAPSQESAPFLLRGIMLERGGQISAAAAAYNEALRRNPQDERAKQLLAKVVADAEMRQLTVD